MNVEEFRNYCLSKIGVTEHFPFDETTLVFKVMDKMFALTDTEDDFKINIKCDPEKAIELREKYPERVLPGYHMNKNLWNTVIIDGLISDKVIYKWIDRSYDLIVGKLPKIKRDEMKRL